jgi:hypothetical protein
LDILFNLLLPDAPFDLPLCFNVEWIVVQSSRFVSSLLCIPCLSSGHFSPQPPKLDRVLYDIGELRVFLDESAHVLGVCENGLTDLLDTVWIRFAGCWGGSSGSWVSRLRLRTADQHGQHLSVLETGVFERLAVIAESLAVVKDGLGGSGKAGLAFDGGFEGGEGQAQRDIEGDEVLVAGLAICVDGYGDSCPAARSVCGSRPAAPCTYIVNSVILVS